MSSTPKAEKRCRHCGETVVGDHGARVRHARECTKRPAHDTPDSASSPPPAAPSPPPVLKPLPVCPTCGKLFRNDAVLGEHVCPWTKASKTPEPGASAKKKGPLGREGLQGACHGRRIEAFNAECNALRDYDNRMQRLLAKQALSPPPNAATPSAMSSAPQSTTRSIASTMSFTGGAERTRCRRCGKLVLTTTLRLHRDSCVVVKLGAKLERLKELLGTSSPGPNPMSASPSLNQSAITSASSAKSLRPAKGAAGAAALDLPEAYARVDEMDSILAALAAVVDVPSGLRRSDGTLSERRVRAALPDLEVAFEDWRADVAAKVAATPLPAASPARGPPLTLVSPRDASPTPGLRSVAHRPPADLSPTRTKKADDSAIRRCAELAATKSAAAQDASFDAEVLALAEAVRRGDLTLADATLPNHGVFRASGFASAVNPTLRAGSPE